MAIPLQPSNFYVQTGNQQNLVSWDISVGATSYEVQRSLDGVTFVTVSSPAVTSYLDTSVTIGVQYWYQVASTNADGTSGYTESQSVVPTISGEMSLSMIRLSAQQRADRVNSQFVTLPEWNSYINQAMFELYDLLVTSYEDYFVATPVAFNTNGSTYLYPLPNGIQTFTDPSGSTITAPPMYKLLGVDLGLNTANNAWVTLNKFNFIDRNQFVYPNTNSTIYGVYNMRYRVMGDKIEFIPIPSSGQPVRLWYVPRLTQLLKDTDTTTTGISGWIEYVIVRAAKYALDKEESDTSKLDQQLVFLTKRIEEAAQGRDIGQPDTISNVRNSQGSNNGFGPGGSTAGW